MSPHIKDTHFARKRKNDNNKNDAMADDAREQKQRATNTARADVMLEKKWPAELDILQSAFPHHVQSTVLRALANAEGCLEKAGEMLLRAPKDLDDACIATKTKSGREVKTPLMSGDELFAQNGGGHARKPKREEKFWCQVLREETTKVLPEEEKEGKERGGKGRGRYTLVHDIKTASHTTAPYFF